MVLKALTDAGEFVHRFNAVLAQLFRITYPGQHKHLGRVDGATGENDFPPHRDRLFGTRPVPVGDPGDLPAIHVDPADERMGDDLQVLACARRFQECHRGTAAAAVFRCQLKIADAFLGRAVVVRVEGIPRRLRGRDPGIADRPLDTHVGDGERATGPVKRVGATLLVLGALEQRQDVVPAPAFVAHLAPAVVVLFLPAHIKKTVQRR